MCLAHSYNNVQFIYLAKREKFKQRENGTFYRFTEFIFLNFCSCLFIGHFSSSLPSWWYFNRKVTRKSSKMWVFSTFVSVGLHAIFGWQTGFIIGDLEVWSEFWALLLHVSDFLGWIKIFLIQKLRCSDNCTRRGIHLCAFCVRCSLSRYDSTGNIHNSRR